MNENIEPFHVRTSVHACYALENRISAKLLFPMILAHEFKWIYELCVPRQISEGDRPLKPSHLFMTNQGLKKGASKLAGNWNLLWKEMNAK